MLQNLCISGSCIKMAALCRMSWQKYINAAGSAGRAETAGDRGYRFIDGQLDQKDQLESGGRISILYYGKFNSKKKNEQT